MIRAHLAYARGLLDHKRHVLTGCRRMGVGLWRGLLHDWTKFTPREWGPYVRQFRNPDGTKRDARNADGSSDPAAQSLDFQHAWISHQRNPHHWQSWISIGDNGALTAMPEVRVREMISDWIGAGLSYASEPNPWKWYSGNVGKMVLHPQTRTLLARLMARFEYEQ